MSTTTAALTITGMHCASCGMLIDESLEDLPGVSSSATSVRKGTCMVSFDDQRTSLEKIAAEISGLGYGAAILNRSTSA